ncbi:MAG: hypothetical protein SFX74_03090 [Fimbriimonadaceae bacterium]|nr:hypothetical protein [Fimbriimonadaceae bacterium]
MRNALSKQVAIKPDEQFARSYVDRLILEKLTEMESAVKLSELAERLADHQIGLAAVRSLLASNPDRFAFFERRWIPAARLESHGRPIAEVIRLTLDRFGGPMFVPLLITEISRIREEGTEVVEPTVRRILTRDRQFVLTPNDEAGLTEWGFVAHDESTERGYAINRVTAADVEEVAAKLVGFDWRQPHAVAIALQKVAPVSLRVLGAVCWSAVNPQDPRAVLTYDARQFVSDALSAKGFVYAAGGYLHPESDAAKWVSTAVRLADRLTPTVELDDAAPLEIKPEDVDRLLQRVSESDASTTATKLLEAFYEITPGSKTFTDDLSNMIKTLRSEDAIVWVGGDRFRRAGSLPDMLNELPEPFQFVTNELKDEEGELIDVELTDDGLSTSLRKLLVHTLAMDVLDEDISPAPKTMPDSARLVLKSIHRELGTFPMCQLPTGFIDGQPGVQELLVVDGDGRELSVWANNQTRLLYNWIDWWFEQPIESGAVFTLTKTNRPNVFEFAWMDQPDPVVHINTARMEELRTIGMNSDGKSTLDILIEVFAHWPKGADFLTLLAEVNVVRRTSRRLVASLLSSYQCFNQRSGSPVWHYDAKKVELGFDKTKKKFIRK